MIMLSTALIVMLCVGAAHLDARDSFTGMRDDPEAFRSSIASRATRSRMREGAQSHVPFQHERSHAIKQKHMQNIKQHILDTLGLQQAPQIPANATANLTPHLISNFFNESQTQQQHLPLKEQQNQEQEQEQSRKEEQSLVPKDQLDKSAQLAPVSKDPPNEMQIIHAEPMSAGPNRHALQFKLHAPPGEDHRVTEANLRIMVCYRKKDKSKKKPGHRVKIKLYQLIGQPEEQELIATVISVVRHTKWQRLLLPSTLVQNIMESAERTLKVKVVCINCGEDVELVLSRKNGKRQTRSNRRRSGGIRRKPHKRRRSKVGKNPNMHTDRTPYLEIHTANKLHRRLRKRDVESTTHGHLVSPGCCELKEYVDFREFGWHTWILSPRGFNQTICVGNCSNSDSSLPQGAAESTCCHPIETSSLPVVYLNEQGEVQRAQIPNLVTHQCGCH